MVRIRLDFAVRRIWGASLHKELLSDCLSPHCIGKVWPDFGHYYQYYLSTFFVHPKKARCKPRPAASRLGTRLLFVFNFFRRFFVYAH